MHAITLTLKKKCNQNQILVWGDKCFTHVCQQWNKMALSHLTILLCGHVIFFRSIRFAVIYVTLPGGTKNLYQVPWKMMFWFSISAWQKPTFFLTSGRRYFLSRLTTTTVGGSASLGSLQSSVAPIRKSIFIFSIPLNRKSTSLAWFASPLSMWCFLRWKYFLPTRSLRETNLCRRGFFRLSYNSSSVTYAFDIW